MSTACQLGVTVPHGSADRFVRGLGKAGCQPAHANCSARGASLAWSSVQSRSGRALRHRQAQVTRTSRCSRAAVAEVWEPPTVSETKRKFYEGYQEPIPGVYQPVVLELLVQHHLIRYNRKYQYDEVFGLGLVSVADQVLEGMPSDMRKPLFDAYIKALNEDPESYRSDSARMEAWASSLSGPEAVLPNADGDDVQKALAGIAERAAAGNFLYSKFFAIGLFRLLELTGAKDPKALEALVKAVGVRADSVNRDLMTYKGVLSKLSAAKEMMNEYLEREKRKQAERSASKSAAGSDGGEQQGEKKVAEETVDISA